MAKAARPDSDASSDERWKPKRPERPSGEFSMLEVRDRVVIKLLYEELVRVEDVERAWDEWRNSGADARQVPLWRVMVKDGEIDSETVFAEAAKAYSFPSLDTDAQALLKSLPRVKSMLKAEVWAQLGALGIVPARVIGDNGAEAGRLVLATHDPGQPGLFRRVKDLGIKDFELWYAPAAFVKDFRIRYGPNSDDFADEHEGLTFDLGTMDEESSFDEDLDAEINRSALIALFERILREAVRQGASDIHIYPNAQRKTEIHFRINGELTCWRVEDRVHPEAILAVVKDNAHNVDRFEREMSQDGFMQRTIDDAVIRFRVSVIPLATARLELRSESIVIRVLDDRKVVRDLAKLGLSALALERFNWAIRQPYGMVVLTGPTGSGKSTTLYAALAQIVSPKLNVLTVEDPVEYIIPEVRQVKLTHKFGLETALRSLLRHDPDVVMVGEMRDRITAELAIKLANTGHLSFSTLHTNDAPSTVSRLVKMGIEPFLIAYSINLVVAQRLIRVLCPKCRKEDKQPDEKRLAHLGFSLKDLKKQQFFTAAENGKCDACRGSGYKGRQAITETMPFSPEIRDLIVASGGQIREEEIRAVAVQQGMLTLADRARELVLDGTTSADEMVRVVFTGV